MPSRTAPPGSCARGRVLPAIRSRLSLERGLVDEAGVVIPDQDAPFCLGEATHPLARVAMLVDVSLPAGFAERVRAGIDRALEHAVDLVVGRGDPPDLACQRRGGELHALAAHPQPHLADRAELGEPVEDRLDRAADRFVGIEQDLAVVLAPHQPDRQCLAQLPARGLVTDPAVQACPEDVQLSLAHRAFESEQEPVVERAGVVEAVGVADHGVGHAAEVQQPVPVDVVARQSRDFQAEHQPGVTERDLGRQPGEPGTLRHARPADPEVLVDHDDLLATEPELDRALNQRVLPGVDSMLRSSCVGRIGANTRTPGDADASWSASIARSPTAVSSSSGSPTTVRAINAASRVIAVWRCSSPTSSHNATAGAGLSASSRRNCTIAPRSRIIARSQDDTLKQRLEHPSRGEQILKRASVPVPTGPGVACRSVHAAGTIR